MRRQKTRPLALLLSLGLVLGLAGCGSMLERSYASVTPHTQFSDESDSGSVLRAETYQGLVSALLHLVEQGAEKGELRLYQYSSVTGAAASDVDQACLEVTQEDPLGAYAVDYIKYDVEQTVSYYQINVTLAYNIDPKELKDVISVTGSTAVRQELEELLRTSPKRSSSASATSRRKTAPPPSAKPSRTPMTTNPAPSRLWKTSTSPSILTTASSGWPPSP